MIFRRRKSKSLRSNGAHRSRLSRLFPRLEPLEERQLLTFAAPITMPLNDVPECFAMGDFNGDGKLDLAVDEGYNAPDQLDIYLGNGSGGFESPISYNLSGTGMSAIEVADLRGDGKLDIVGVFNGGVEVFLGNGDGTFQTPHLMSVGDDLSITIGDANGDGRPDIVLGGTNAQGDDAIQVLLSNGDGTFQTPITSTFSYYRSPQGYVDQPTSIALGDLNGDGKVDVVTASSFDQQVLVSMGNGDGTFQAPKAYETGPIPRADLDTPAIAQGVTSLVLGDFSHNGKLDIAATNRDARSVSVLMGNGDGTFRSAVNYQAGGQPHQMVAGDFDADGKLDLALTETSSNSVVVLFGRGNGAFRPPVNLASLPSPEGIAVGDLNQDGLSDLAVTSYAFPAEGAPAYTAISYVLLGQRVSADVTSAEQFIQQVYQQFLARPVDPAALTFWNNYLEQGGSRLEVALAVQASVEYRGDQVEALFQRYLQRSADPADVASFVQFLGNGGTLAELTAALIGSAEYEGLLNDASDSAFVRALFQDVLGRAATNADISYYGSLLAQGASRGQLSLLVISSREYHDELAQSWYVESLGRSAEPLAVQFIDQLLAAGQDDEQILAEIVASDEYARDTG